MPRGLSSATAIARAEVEVSPSKYLDAGKILTIEQYNQTQLFWPVFPSLHEIRFRKVRSWISTSVDRRCNIYICLISTNNFMFLEIMFAWLLTDVKPAVLRLSTI